MGTVGYMSPEQAQGKTTEIDHRSDIFSFGCILNEAATSKKPFQGDSVLKSLHMVAYEPAPLIADLNPSAPAELQRIVRRCLEKDTDERYQGIKEVAIELKQLRRELETGTDFDTTVPPPVTFERASSTDSGYRSSPPPRRFRRRFPARIRRAESQAAQTRYRDRSGDLNRRRRTLRLLSARGKNRSSIDSIAVLPFQNKSSDADTEYLSDGLAESLIYRLSQLPNLKVSPTSSVIRYKGKDTPTSLRWLTN